VLVPPKTASSRKENLIRRFCLRRLCCLQLGKFASFVCVDLLRIFFYISSARLLLIDLFRAQGICTDLSMSLSRLQIYINYERLNTNTITH
jgi:hypothetical protein